MNPMISEIAPRPMPVAAQDKAAAGSISYAIGKCALGQILAARSASGLCAILIGADGQALEAGLAARFPKSKLSKGGTAIRDDLAKIIRFANRPGEGLDLALDLRGTPFQRRVWQALRTIPAGTTVSYAELARRIGAPRAVRAVANACGANPVALAVPCHRVVRSNGNLGGYHWGIERKRELIEKEAMA